MKLNDLLTIINGDEYIVLVDIHGETIAEGFNDGDEFNKYKDSTVDGIWTSSEEGTWNLITEIDIRIIS